MKQFVIDQMKEYQHKQTMIKAVKYQEGMEDAWIVEYENRTGDFEIIYRLFVSKEEARKYIAGSADEINKIRSDYQEYTEYIDFIPVILHEISKEEYEESGGCFIISDGSNYYEYEKIEDDCWLIMDNRGIVHGYYDTEQFFEDYETPVEKSDVHIGYDGDEGRLYVENNCIRVFIEETEVATVEKLLEGFGISFTEKIGQVFLR